MNNQTPTNSAGDGAGGPGNDPSLASGGNAGGGDLPQKSPLDILEELLNDTKAKGGAKGKSSAALPGVNPGVPDGGAADEAAEAAAKAEEAAKAAEEAERQRIIAQRKLEDEQHLIAQRAAMEELKNTPQYQARVQQDQQEEEEHKQHDEAVQGYEIKQLEHKKI
jgi:hypothetical protein